MIDADKRFHERWFGVAPDQEHPALRAERRKRSGDVTTELSRQVFEALEILLAGFVAAEERDGTKALHAALAREGDHLYAGLLTLLLRLVFLLSCEAWGLLPVEHPLFTENYSLLGLFNALRADHETSPDTMLRRFGAYPRLVALFRAVFLGVTHGDLHIPPRRGTLFDPAVHPFLEGRAPAAGPEARAALVLPSIDDGTVYSVLEKLLYLGGQRLSYKALDVEQIGSVYEALMGFSVRRIESGAVRIKLGHKKGAARVWVEAAPLLVVPENQRERWLKDELAFDKAVAAKIAEAVTSAQTVDQALLALEPLSGKTPERASAGMLVIQPGPERRRTSSHYTPRELTEPIVARTLAPLIEAMGDSPSSEALLHLVVCDPAVGSGAFLVAACRYLADQVVAAWTREGALSKVASAHEDVVNHARRLVAQRCLYGVDKNTYAVQLARLSLWLVTMARNEPFTFVDHAIRHGDSLLGLSFEQIRAFHWKPKSQVDSAGLLAEALDEAIGIRKRILGLANEGTFEAQREKERLLLDAEDALGRVRLIADLVVGAFFSQKNDKDREKDRRLRLDRVTAWLAAEKRGDVSEAEGILAELRGMQAELWATQAPFHWRLEFPEVFGPGRPGTAGVDAFIGNPPFAGKNALSAARGGDYLAWLQHLHEGTHGNADVCAHFFRRAVDLSGPDGAVGFVGPVSISEGDTRSTGLKPILEAGGRIFAARRNGPWPGGADVRISIVHLARGRLALRTRPELDGRPVEGITSRLQAGRERSDPTPLARNAGLVYVGIMLGGSGFELREAEAAELLRSSPGAADVVRKLLGGEQFNESPRQDASRWVIDFGEMSLDRARQYTRPMAIVEERVKPLRDRNARATRREKWWQFSERSVALSSSLQSATECIAVAQSARHTAFAIVPAQQVFINTMYVFPSSSATLLATLQSRIHLAWAMLLASTHGGLGTVVRYRADEVVSTFPFPAPDPRAILPPLESIGKTLHETRAHYMASTSQGLTKTYSALKDPSCEAPRILDLRALHEEMDRAVLTAYGWSDLPVPPYCAHSGEDRAAQQRFEDEVIDRLYMLNATRVEAEEEEAPSWGFAPGPTRGCPPLDPDQRKRWTRGR
ncbi:DNA methyltransferase [Polyangium sp. 6x1]|uniref:Eco57I restriction-modification methylase domain-containing protein n=1 Tax=Polyangium sp. 6x1 TaxID=3042689 RepID=UPI0024823E31|nr:DNA methyltransferase [Polyangium sp. 6x1]MDI1450906.1 N-6 DNA methylase [Polyangium sp. 6x1]